MYQYIQKALDWGVKVASLAVTGPATWIVASELFQDVTLPVLYFVMRFSAVFLIEGVLLSNWLLLEFDKKATPEIKARYGITALAMYTALLVIGWRHEGPTGLVFRVALLAALIGSGWDTYVYTWQRATSRVDRSASNARRVKRHARRLSVREAITRRNAEHETELALIKAQGDAGLEQMGLYRERLIASVQLDDHAERLKLEDAETRLLAAGANGRNGKKKPELPPPPPIDIPDLETSNSPGEAQSEEYRLRLSILDAFGEDPRYTRRQLADKLGVSYNIVSRIVKELADEEFLDKEGRAMHLTERGQRYVRGKVRRAAANGK